jgi:multisubunit Na+/H+ antiporter MnhB subunit
MKRLSLLVASLAAILGLGFALASPIAFAATTVPRGNINEICSSNPNSSVCKDWAASNNPETQVTSTTQNIINLMLYAIGIIAVLLIIISSMRFVSSRGDSNAVSKARTALIYSVVGLVVAVTAFAIVNFVIFRLSEGNSGGGGGGTTPTTPTTPTSQWCADQGKGFDAGPPPKCI